MHDGSLLPPTPSGAQVGHFCARPLRPNVRGAPRFAPLRRRSSTGRVGSSPRPPCPPPIILLTFSFLTLVRFWYDMTCFMRRYVVGWVRCPSVSFRPPRFRSDVGRPPMCPAPFPPPSLRHAFGRGARRGGLLGSLRSLRFKCPRVRAPSPSRLAIVR